MNVKEYILNRFGGELSYWEQFAARHGYRVTESPPNSLGHLWSVIKRDEAKVRALCFDRSEAVRIAYALSVLFPVKTPAARQVPARRPVEVAR